MTPAFIPSKNPEVILDFLSLGIKGFKAITNINDGRNIPSVDNTAPQKPAMKYPIAVAVVSTGPGVNCPIATASKRTPGVNHPKSPTNVFST